VLIAATQPDVTVWWAPALAFLAGAVSFASPCVFPLVPGYVSFVTAGHDADRRSLAPILLFILGFASIFTLLGAFSRTFVPLLKDDVGQRVAGGVVIVAGVLMVAYALRVGGARLFAERRPFLERIRLGTVGALPLGMAFAAGWTPCVGPVLAAILGLSVTSGSAWRAAFLLFCYSLGLGLPFLLVGLGVQRFMGAFGWVRRNYRWITGTSGVLLTAVGVLLATGQLTRLFTRLSGYSPLL
jgi:cytochrome c-type biogenesis protein